jgi:hypothetical protein
VSTEDTDLRHQIARALWRINSQSSNPDRQFDDLIADGDGLPNGSLADAVLEVVSPLLAAKDEEIAFHRAGSDGMARLADQINGRLRTARAEAARLTPREVAEQVSIVSTDRVLRKVEMIQTIAAGAASAIGDVQRELARLAAKLDPPAEQDPTSVGASAGTSNADPGSVEVQPVQAEPRVWREGDPEPTEPRPTLRADDGDTWWPTPGGWCCCGDEPTNRCTSEDKAGWTFMLAYAPLTEILPSTEGDQ